MTKAGDKNNAPRGPLMKALADTWGSLSQMQGEFNIAAASHFGSGWAWLYLDAKTNKLAIMSTSNQDNPWMESNYPILGLDLWEHAYYLKYQNRRPAYIEAWWNVVNWQKVSSLYAEHTATLKSELR
jgi:Fe-Mn family superoxide dismutase